MTTEVLVAKVSAPNQRFRISKELYEANEDAYIVQEAGCEGGKSFDQLSPAAQKSCRERQADRVVTSDPAEDEEEE